MTCREKGSKSSDNVCLSLSAISKVFKNRRKDVNILRVALGRM